MALGACLGLHLAPSVVPRNGASLRTREISMLILGPNDGIHMGDGVPDGPQRMTVGDDYVDPLFTKRPKYDLCAASGRPEEICCGAVAPDTAFDIDEWAAHMRGEGKLQPFSWALALLDDDEASLRSPDGTPTGYEDALRAAGFSSVTRVDLYAPGSRDLVYEALRAAKAAKERVCIHCADGTSRTSIVMADWLLTDYIGGDNCEEAAEALRSRKRLSGVERLVDAEVVAKFIVAGCAGVDAVEGSDEDDPPTTVSPGGILLL